MAKNDLELLTVLPLYNKCGDGRHVPPLLLFLYGTVG